MITNPLLSLAQSGQSIWLDYFTPSILEDGELMRLIEEDGLKGMTINPSIFEKAVAEDGDYDDRVTPCWSKAN
jgi:transaldolase